MQRKKYFQWITIAVVAIVAVVVLVILILKNKKEQSQTQTSPTPSTSVTPITNASDLPTSVPSTTPTPVASATATPNGVDHKALAQAAYANKQYTTAISEYLQAINQTANASELAILWNELGNTYRDNQNSAEALKAYDKALSYNAKLGDAYLNKAALQWVQNQKDPARDTLRAGINAEASRKTDLQNTLSVYEADQ